MGSRPAKDDTLDRAIRPSPRIIWARPPSTARTAMMLTPVGLCMIASLYPRFRRESFPRSGLPIMTKPESDRYAFYAARQPFRVGCLAARPNRTGRWLVALRQLRSETETAGHARLRELVRGEQLIELLGRENAALDDDLSDRPVLADRLLGDLGGQGVAEVRRERRRQG